MAMDYTMKLCEDLGHNVENLKIDFSSAEIGFAIQTIVSANVAYVMNSQSIETNREVSGNFFENVSLKMAENGNNFKASEYVAALKINHKIGQTLEKIFLDYDAILSPVLAKPPVELGYINMNTDDMSSYIERLTTYSPFTGIFNQSGTTIYVCAIIQLTK
jgi:Asp-tRNA(Asn)/Glu-tRNA(Gln) amidotransferase A subunit family amidase